MVIKTRASEAGRPCFLTVYHRAPGSKGVSHRPSGEAGKGEGSGGRKGWDGDSEPRILLLHLWEVQGAWIENSRNPAFISTLWMEKLRSEGRSRPPHGVRSPRQAS